jgi:hypothetical protein
MGWPRRSLSPKTSSIRHRKRLKPALGARRRSDSAAYRPIQASVWVYERVYEMVSGRPYTLRKLADGPKGPSFKRLLRKLVRAMVACLPQAAPSFHPIARLPIVGSPSLPSWTDQTGGSLRYRTSPCPTGQARLRLTASGRPLRENWGRKSFFRQPAMLPARSNWFLAPSSYCRTEFEFPRLRLGSLPN